MILQQQGNMKAFGYFYRAIFQEYGNTPGT